MLERRGAVDTTCTGIDGVHGRLGALGKGESRQDVTDGGSDVGPTGRSGSCGQPECLPIDPDHTAGYVHS